MHDKTNPSVSVKFKEVEGLSIYLDVYIPQNDVNELDVMFYIHGGAMVAMDRTDIPRWLPVKAQKYNSILISTDYRLAPQAKISDSFQDVIDAFRNTFIKLESYLHSTGHLRHLKYFSKHAIVFGGSAGGWLCLLLGTVDHFTYIEKLCLGAIYPMTNLTDEHYEKPLQTPNLPQVEYSRVKEYIDGPLVAGGNS